MDKITVIEQTTAERKKETVTIFNEIKPLLDNGVPFYKAVKSVKNLKHDGFLRQAWYKELKQYAKTQGYTPNGKNNKSNWLYVF